LAARGTQAEDELQYMAAGQSALDAHVARQPSCGSHTPERHAADEVQGVPSGSPHLPSAAHRPLRHCVAAEQVSALGRDGTHAPPLQKRPAPHCASCVQEVAHEPDAHTPERHTDATVHVWPPGFPHLPSEWHAPERHCAALVQVSSLALSGTHAPVPQK